MRCLTLIAPRSQTNVPVILWMGAQHHDYDVQRIRKEKDNNYSHDNVFHTLLGLFEIESDIYEPSMNLIRQSQVSH